MESEIFLRLFEIISQCANLFMQTFQQAQYLYAPIPQQLLSSMYNWQYNENQSLQAQSETTLCKKFYFFSQLLKEVLKLRESWNCMPSSTCKLSLLLPREGIIWSSVCTENLEKNMMEREKVSPLHYKIIKIQLYMQIYVI